jgi:hypothetical protein
MILLCVLSSIDFHSLMSWRDWLRQVAWRPILARLQLLARLVPIWGVTTSGGEGLPLEGLMKFVGPTFGNANADVRSAAINLTILVSSPCFVMNCKSHVLPAYSVA